MPSSAPVVKAALLTMLRARVGLNGVQVEWATPTTFAAQEFIWLGKVVDKERPVALGRQSRDESYTIECIVWNAQDGDDAQSVETRWWAMAGEVEKAIQADATIAGTVSQWAIVEGIEQHAFAQPGLRGSEGFLSILCKNRK